MMLMREIELKARKPLPRPRLLLYPWLPNVASASECDERLRVDLREGSSGKRELSIQNSLSHRGPRSLFNYEKYHNTVEESDPGAGVEVAGSIEDAEAWVETWDVGDTRGLRRDLKPRGLRRS
jgi:hypothetical protein